MSWSSWHGAGRGSVFARRLSVGVSVAVLAGTTASMADVRSMDGSGNNIAHPAWGARGQHLLRLTGTYYADGISALSGADRPNPRAISNDVGEQPGEIFGSPMLSSFAVFWGQFIDHDMSRSKGTTPTELAVIFVPQCDPVMDPDCTGFEVIFVERSHYDEHTGIDVDNPREQDNDINAFLDGSNVYGNWDSRGEVLRTYRGGKLKTSESEWGDLLPINTALEDMDTPPFGVDLETLFMAGDDRANETLTLAALHTLFMREHNRLCDELAAEHPDWNDEELYQHARKLVGGMIQSITYNDWLPVLLGANALPEYTGYDPDVNPGIATEFSTFAFRFGHTMINPIVLRLNEDGSVIDQGNLQLRDSFFAIDHILNEGGIDPLLRGMAANPSQEVDPKLTNELRNFLFTPPTILNMDLLSFNIQRGRDHGLGSYNQVRQDLGLPPAASFADITSDVSLQAALATAYDNDVDLVDPFVGGFAEDHLPGATFGELVSTVLVNQFTRLRDGDRFWYQYDDELSESDIALIESSSLSDIIKRNTSIKAIQDSIFYVWPDFDQNGDLNMLDFIAFQNAFQSGDDDADFDKDGKLTVVDFVLFQGAFQSYF